MVAHTVPYSVRYGVSIVNMLEKSESAIVWYYIMAN